MICIQFYLNLKRKTLKQLKFNQKMITNLQSMRMIKKLWHTISILLINFLHHQKDHGSALHASATEKQWDILAEYTSGNCVLRPHLCPNGFTLAFYTKIRPITEVTNKIPVKMSGLLKNSNQFAFSRGKGTPEIVKVFLHELHVFNIFHI